jgi:hypothetical protein
MPINKPYALASHKTAVLLVWLKLATSQRQVVKNKNNFFKIKMDQNSCKNFIKLKEIDVVMKTCNNDRSSLYS